MTTVYLDPRSKQEDTEELSPTTKSPAYYIGVILGVVVGIPVAFMLLWNWLMPVIFGLPTIGFFKSMGLLVMSFILFRK